ncbi:MAG TPA: CBS domain-containing protein [Micromonosporaceae bacterium]|nr:CBS domain-containing protein [Micromonosporaceae bacterium]
MKRWTVGDVMRRDVVTVAPTASLRGIADLLVAHRISAVPVVDGAGRVLGVVSEADLLAKLEYADRVPHHALATRRLRAPRGRAPGDSAADLMSAPAVTITVDASVARAARLMDAARVKRLPVVDATDRLIGLVSRHDLLRLFTRRDEDVRAEVAEALRSVGGSADEVTVLVDRGVVTLRGVVDDPTVATLLLGVATAVPGAVDVVDELHCVGGGRSSVPAA